VQSPSPDPKLPDFHGRVSCRKVVYGDLNATEVEARISAQAQRLEISPVTGQLFDGQVKAQLESDLSGPSPVHSLELELENFHVGRIHEFLGCSVLSDGVLKKKQGRAVQ
jgi:hypothetical protein